MMSKTQRTIEPPVKYELTELDVSRGDHIQCRVYKWRWVILALFMLFGMISLMSWIQYAIIANIVMRYYGVSSYAVDWTSMIFMLIYIPVAFPALYILVKKGLRVSILIGTLGTAIGSCIKVASVAPDRFAVAFAGHTIVGVSQVFLLSVPPRLAAAWFGSDQVSTACSLATSGFQVGVALGFLLPPIMIRNHKDIEDIGNDISIFNYGMAACSIVLFILVFLLFKDAPPVPPSVAQFLQQKATKVGFLESMKRLMVNRGYLLLLTSYGICLGVLNCVSTLLNQLIMKYFVDGEQFAGRVGLVISLSGLAGAVGGGIVLDKTQKYKETTLAFYIFSFVGMLSFTFVLAYESHLLVYLTSALLGCCLGSIIPVGFELAMELTYPEPEGTSAGILFCVCQGVSFVFTLIYSRLVTSVGDVWANVTLCAILAVGTVLTAMIPRDMRRLAATRTKAVDSVR